MQTLYIFCGIPFSGKTQLSQRVSQKLGYTLIDLDEVKFATFGRGITDDHIDQDGWDRVYRNMYVQIRDALRRKETVIHDTGNFTLSERNMVRKIADDLNIDAITVYVDTPIDIARKRMVENRKTRERFDITDSAFDYAVSEMEPPQDDETHIVYDGSQDFNDWLYENFLHRT